MGFASASWRTKGDVRQATLVDESKKPNRSVYKPLRSVAQGQVVGIGNVTNRLEEEIVSDVLARDIAT